jgi:PAS domain S-box-containing protein
MAKSLTVLIVGNVESDTRLILRQLKKGGYKPAFERVKTPSQMRRALKKTDWEIVISAFDLPTLDGFTALKILQETGLDIPFIVFSDSLGEGAAVAMMQAGACICFPKDNLGLFLPVVERELRLAAERRERRQVEDALRASEDKFKYAFDHSVTGKSITLPSGEIEVNQAFCKMLGYSQKELKNRKWQEITHPADVEITQNAIDKLMSGEKDSVRLNKRFIHKNGSIVWVDLGSAIRRDGDGKPLYLLTTLSDITERIRAEEELRDLSSRQEAILAAVPDILMEVDHDKVYTWANPSGLEFFGKDVIGKNADYYFEGEQATYDAVTPLFQGSKDVIYVESWQRRKDGNKRLLAWWCRSLKDKDGNVIGALSSAHDITERKRAEEEIRNLNAELELHVEERTRELRQAQDKIVLQEKLAVLGQLAGGLGHELRNPLGIISNAIYYLKIIQPDADENVKQYHAMIEQEVRNSDKIITDLLDFARVESMEREPIAVHELVQRTLTRFPVPQSIKTDLRVPEDLPRVFADPRQMEQVLGNLTVNAYQAMVSHRSTTGEVKGGTLTISARRQKGTVAIAVKDTGTGITPENMGRLFEPLFTTKSKGIGLGLAVSRKLVEANGGRIEVKSKPGKGSTFTLFLPVEGK